MPVPFLSDIDLRGNKTLNAVLSGVKFGSAPSSPQVGHFYQKDGVLYYRNIFNTETPVHENAITTITGGGALTASTTNRVVSLAIASASSTQPGIMAAADYSLPQILGITNSSAYFQIQATAAGNCSALNYKIGLNAQVI